MVNVIGQIPRAEVIGGGKRAEWGDRGASGFGDGDEDIAGLRAVAFLDGDLHMNLEGNGGAWTRHTGFGPGVGVKQMLELW